MTGFIYAIGDETGRVKIGWSQQPVRRLAKISSDCSSAVTLLGIVQATQSQEKEIHTLLSPWRINREWFRHEETVAVFVSMLAKPKPRLCSGRPRLKSSTSPWDTIIDAAGGTGAVAKGLEQLLSTISGWRSRGIPSPYWAGIVRLAVAGGRDDITLDMLANLRAAHKLELMPSPTGATAIAPCQGELPNF